MPKTVPAGDHEAKGTFWILFVPAKSIWCAVTKATCFVKSKAQQTKANHTKLNQQCISLDGQDNPSET
ncbi:hypothetical protein QNE28_004343 [Vibrio fluvialis]|nr:hypothetical protein [Vibrio fluvialis]